MYQIFLARLLTKLFSFQRKLFALLFVSIIITTVSSETTFLSCTFVPSVLYTCKLNSIELLNTTRRVVIHGDHLDGKTDDDVEVVHVLNSNTPFMIPQIFTTFPNVQDLGWVYSNLESINIPDTVQLKKLTLTGNNITRINRGNLNNQLELFYLSLIDNQIEEIDKNAFVGLEKLRTVNLMYNRLSEIANETFHPLVGLNYIDFEHNLLTRIDEDLFSQNRNLSSIYLEFNRINKISPRFLSGIVDNLRFINLEGNDCINRAFDVKDEIGEIVMNNALHACFNNFYGGEVSETRRITLEFQGTLSLFDEFGNIIARVN